MPNLFGMWPGRQSDCFPPERGRQMRVPIEYESLGQPLRFVSLRHELGMRAGLLLTQDVDTAGTELLFLTDLAQLQAVGTRRAYGIGAGGRAFDARRLELLCGQYRLSFDDLTLRGNWLYGLLKEAGLSIDLHLKSLPAIWRQQQLGAEQFVAWLADPRVTARQRLPDRVGLLSAASDGFCHVLPPTGGVSAAAAYRFAAWRDVRSPVAFVALLRIEDPIEVLELLSHEGRDLRRSPLRERELLRDQLLAELSPGPSSASFPPSAAKLPIHSARQQLAAYPACWPLLRLHHPQQAHVGVLRADS